MSTVQLEAAPARASAPLGVVTDLCRRLDEAEVSYCHWKSNEHLRAATLGETDLDLLVDRQSAPRVAQVLAEGGWKRMVAVPARSYVGIEDYLGLDQATGKLAHLHLHYRLVLGEKFLKGYRLPWEGRILAGRRLDREARVYVSAPELELIVLLVRAALKLRHREAWFGGSSTADADFLREFRWLADRIDPAVLQSEATELLGSSAASAIAATLATTPDRAALVRFRSSIADAAATWRTYPAPEARRRRWARESRARCARLWSRVSGRRQVTRFHDPRGGVIIAFLGADGSGKSTITRAITAWLSWRLEVVPLYFGFGDGPVSPVRRPLQALKSAYSRQRRTEALRQHGAAEPQSRSKEPATPSWRALPKIVWRILWSWSVVREKESRLRQAQRGRNLGLVVICDRYPQAQIMGMGDGPLLSHLERHPWAWFRSVARWELDAYRRMESIVPDLVIKLQVSPEVSARRKQDGSLDALARRAEVVNRVQFPGVVRTAQVDADQAIEQVLLEVRRLVWEVI